jgi:hypothetical protein
MAEINWPRVGAHVVLLLLASTIAVLPFQLWGNYLQAHGQAPPVFIPFAGFAASLVASLAVFARLGYRQEHQPILHGLLVAAFSIALSFGLNVLVMKAPAGQVVYQLVQAPVLAIAGTWLGTLLRRRNAAATPAEHRTPSAA